MELEWSFIDLSDVRNSLFNDFPHLTEDFNEQVNIFTKLLENKSKDEIEIDSKDIRTIKEKKYDTQHGNIKNFEENSSQKVFNSKWQDLNDRQREYLRKYNYPSVLLTKFFSGKKDF